MSELGELWELKIFHNDVLAETKELEGFEMDLTLMNILRDYIGDDECLSDGWTFEIRRTF